MSAHWEWLTAAHNPSELLRRGDEVHGYDEPVTEDLALVFGPDNGAIIEGSREELVAMLNRALALLPPHQRKPIPRRLSENERWERRKADHEAITGKRIAVACCEHGRDMKAKGACPECAPALGPHRSGDARTEADRRGRVMHGWAFRGLDPEEQSVIVNYLEGGPVPPGYEKSHAVVR